jgi:hypothetical protein
MLLHPALLLRLRLLCLQEQPFCGCPCQQCQQQQQTSQL